MTHPTRSNLVAANLSGSGPGRSLVGWAETGPIGKRNPRD
jgi:hypothetical protein